MARPESPPEPQPVTIEQPWPAVVSTWLLQIIGSSAAIIFGVYSVLSWQAAQRATEQANSANTIALVAICAQIPQNNLLLSGANGDGDNVGDGVNDRRGVSYNELDTEHAACWTCKRRKVKCDERPQRCTNCERMHITCDGYGVKLRWMADPLSEPRTNQNRSGGRIRIGRDQGTIYSMEAIEGFLSGLESDVAKGNLSQRGPFNVFPGEEGCPEALSDGYGQRPREAVSLATSAEVSGDSPAQPLNLVFSEARTYVESMSFLPVDCASLPFPEMRRVSPLPQNAILSAQDAAEDASEDARIFPASDDAYQEEVLSEVDFGKDHVSDEDGVDKPAREATPEPFEIASGPSGLQASSRLDQLGFSADTVIPHSIFAAVSTDTSVNKLMHHYVVHVAGLLQPIDHPLNPYRTLYVPAALTAATGSPSQSLAAAGPNETVHSVLLHSLMSSASFHLWNCNPAQPEYHKLGAQHRRAALSLLNSALERQASSIDYKTLMMAMLSLVSIDILSGCEADFVIHLRGTKQLQKRRKNWRVMSRATRQLNQISDFLFLLTRTTWFPTSLSALSASAYAVEEEEGRRWEEEEETMSAADSTAESCYPYMYGISPTLASYMEETCQLAERLAVHKLRHGDAELPPEPLLEACELLGDRILSWTHALEEEGDGRVLSSTGDPLARTIFRLHAQAWHLAIIIYYFRRIHRCRAPDHAQHVLTIAECMHAVEDIKERALALSSLLSLRRRAAIRMAPITWPAFIASCEGLHRGPWTRWWRRMQCYQIANIRRQWEMIEKLWQQKDRMEQAGRPAAFDWIEVFQGYEQTLMPI